MARDRWLPTKYEVPGKLGLGKLLFAGPKWQIYGAGKKRRVLVATADLSIRWIQQNLLPASVLPGFSFAGEEYRALDSGESNELVPLDVQPSLPNKTDALAFAASIRETRNLDPASPLHDAIYVERYSRLLPTWTPSEGHTDDVVLGTWLAGGVAVPASSVRRLSSLTPWMNREDLREVIEAAGLSGDDSEGVARTRVRSREQEAAKDQIVDKPKESRKSEDQPISGRTHVLFKLPGRPALEAFFHDHVIDIVENAERYKALGIGFPGAILLYGPPGCGKTFAVERLVEYLDWPIFSVDSSSVASPYIHEMSKKVSEIFDKAMDAAPSVVVIDEMDAYLSDRHSGGYVGSHHAEEVSEFLRRIPEATKRHVLVIGMTNRLEAIDAAIRRRGRFDHAVEVGMPSSEEVEGLLESLLAKIPVDGRLDLSDVIETLTGRPLSDAAFAMREAARLAAKAGRSTLDKISLEAALASLPPQEEKKRRPIGFIQD